MMDLSNFPSSVCSLESSQGPAECHVSVKLEPGERRETDAFTIFGFELDTIVIPNLLVPGVFSVPQPPIGWVTALPETINVAVHVPETEVNDFPKDTVPKLGIGRIAEFEVGASIIHSAEFL